jgi:septum formation protein
MKKPPFGETPVPRQGVQGDGVPSPLFVLASESPRRIRLLQSMGLAFQVRPARCDETIHQGESPLEFTRRMALKKAGIVGAREPDAWILAADTVVAAAGRILGKPSDKEEARGMLRLLSGAAHDVITSYCFLRRTQSVSHVRSVRTEVVFKRLTQAEIEGYVCTGEPMDKAGAYAVQGVGAFMVRGVYGSYSNVVGLPLAELVESLVELGIISCFPIRCL